MDRDFFVLKIGIVIIIILTCILVVQNIKLNSAETVYEIDEEEIFGITAGQISMDSHDEAIKAQCVIARTDYMYAIANNTEMPKIYSEDELIKMWGNKYEENRIRLAALLGETSGIVMMWEGKYAYLPYHRISAGETRSLKENYGEEAPGYIGKTACAEDTKAEEYLNIKYFSDEESEDISEKIETVSRDSAGYVMTIVVDGIQLSGEDFREKMGLESSCFTITKKDDGIYIVTKGSGHGYGLSQNQANKMAWKGMDHLEIIKYFFPQTEYKSI